MVLDIFQHWSQHMSDQQFSEEDIQNLKINKLTTYMDQIERKCSEIEVQTTTTIIIIIIYLGGGGRPYSPYHGLNSVPLGYNAKQPPIR